MDNAIHRPFLSGELVNLCIPNDFAIDNDGWADWFNVPDKLQNTRHGIFPISLAEQKAFLESLEGDRTRIVLLAVDKTSSRAFGVVSLQQIDLGFRMAELGVNFGAPERSSNYPLSQLESVALIAEHGFKELGLKRIYGGQVFPALVGWNKMMELIGFRTEGIQRQAFARGHKSQDKMLFCCLYENYLTLVRNRGSLWGSQDIIKNVLRKQPKQAFATVISQLLEKAEAEHFGYLTQDE